MYAFKVMRNDMKFGYRDGRRLTKSQFHEVGRAKICHSGFHAEPTIEGALAWRQFDDDYICVVRLEGKFDYYCFDTKICATRIKLVEKVDLSGFPKYEYCSDWTYRRNIGKIRSKFKDLLDPSVVQHVPDLGRR